MERVRAGETLLFLYRQVVHPRQCGVTIEWKGERVLTTEQLAKAYGCEEHNIKQNFNNNKERFIEGKHYFRLEGEELKAFRGRGENIDLPLSKYASSIYLWTKRGAARHSKMLGTDQAWDVFDELEDTYFNVHDKKNSLPMPNFSNPAEAARAWADEAGMPPLGFMDLKSINSSTAAGIEPVFCLVWP